MTTFTRVAVAVLLLATAFALEPCVPSRAQDAAAPAESPRPRRRTPRDDNIASDARRSEQTIRRGRNRINQILRDPNASSQLKQSASDLNALLDRRRQLIATLKARHKEFVARQQADIAALRDLAQKGREIEARLEAARQDVVRTSTPELTELKQVSERAAELANTVHTTYDQEQRAKRQAR